MRHLDLEIQSYCNLNCVMCPRGTFTEGEMPLVEALAIIQKASEIGVKSIKPFWRGEGTFSRDLIDVLKYSKELGLKTMLNTNSCFVMNPIEIAPYLDWISFSIDEYHENENDRTIENLRYCAKNIDYCEVQSGKLNETIQNICKELNIPYKLDIFTKRSDTDNDSVKLSGERKYCTFPEWRMIVAWNGDVTSCCLDWKLENSTGNIFKDDINTIINKQLAFAERLKKGIYESNVCKNCQSKEAYCG